MCLDLFEGNADMKVAEEDIIVYKFVWDASGDLLAPYRATLYPALGTVIHSLIGWKHPTYDYIDNRKCVGEIEQGLHSFENESDAKAIMKEYVHKGRTKTVVLVKCRIPKGAKYYSGWFYGRHSYASNQLIMDELLDFKLDYASLPDSSLIKELP